MTITVLCNDNTTSLAFAEGQTLLEIIRGENLPVHAPCGGQGTCEKCTVYLVTEAGEQAVLACRTAAEDGMVVRLPSASPLTVELSAREEDICFTPDEGLCGYGVACDIGTTTVVCHLIDLASGKKLATVGEGNAQRAYGGDVISRIKASMEGRRVALTAAITTQLAGMITALCASAKIAVTEVSRMAIAANTTMCHLLTGLSPDSIGVSPFIPLSRFGDEWDARALGLPFDGKVYLAPAISGYVGGDITADLLAVELDRAAKPALLIDVGTNGEMALGCGEHLVSCSTAAGCR